MLLPNGLRAREAAVAAVASEASTATMTCGGLALVEKFRVVRRNDDPGQRLAVVDAPHDVVHVFRDVFD